MQILECPEPEQTPVLPFRVTNGQVNDVDNNRLQIMEFSLLGALSPPFLRRISILFSRSWTNAGHSIRYSGRVSVRQSGFSDQTSEG